MSNINLSQFLNNYGNSFSKFAPNNVQNNEMPQSFVTQNQIQQNQAQQIFPQTTAQLAQTANELAMLNQQQTVNMLKELLQFPKNFEQLLSQLVENIHQSNQQSAFLLLTSGLNLNLLSSLLQTNSKDAMTNLYKMLAQFNQIGVTLKDEQLAELSKLISFVNTSSASDIQSLKTIMQVYLPWLPLTDPDIFKLEITSSGADNSISSDDFVTILISTENFGNLQTTIYKTDNDGIKIELTSSETFPQKEFTALMKEEGIKYNININFDLSQKKVFNKEKKETSKMQICMNTSPGVNMFLLLISNAVIKNVHKIDSKENLKEQRKEKIQNG